MAGKFLKFFVQSVFSYGCDKTSEYNMMFIDITLITAFVP